MIVHSINITFLFWEGLPSSVHNITVRGWQVSTWQSLIPIFIPSVPPINWIRMLAADGSSRFAPGHRWGTFPSVSAGWRISGEKFMQPLQDIVTDLKLRAGWGMNGNQGGFGNYAYMASMSVSKLPVSEGNLYPGLAIKPGSAANKELTCLLQKDHRFTIDS